MGNHEAIHNHYLRFLHRDSLYERGQVVQVIEAMALGLLFLVSFLANGIICIVLLQSNRRQTVSNTFLLSLVSANLSIAIFCVPFAFVSVVIDQWFFGSFWCEASGFLVNFLLTASNLSITAIAIHRYYIVVKPLVLKIDLHRAHFMVGFLWFSSLTCAILPFFGWNSFVYSPGKAQCTLSWRSGGPALVYAVYYTLTTFIIPLGIILAVYRAVYTKAKKQRKLGENVFKGLGSNGHTTRASSAQYIADCQRFVCCPVCIAVNNNVYMQSNHTVISSASLSFDSNSPNSPTAWKRDAADRKLALATQVSRHSSVIQQRTFQSVTAIVISFVVCLSPYFALNTWYVFKQAAPNHFVDFVTSWFYLSMTAVNPMTYGYSNRQIRRAVKRLPLLRAVFKPGRDRTYHIDPAVTYHRNHVTFSNTNEALDNENS